jgi:hypothetical protein
MASQSSDTCVPPSFLPYNNRPPPPPPSPLLC